MPEKLSGKLIVFEGGEGSGKSTQLQLLSAWLQVHPGLLKLQRRGLVSDIVITREPGGTPLGTRLRHLLLEANDDGSEIAPTTELLLYAADRAEHVESFMRPALDQGCWVLCDRYIDSTVAYQGYGRGLSLDLIEQLNAIATSGLQGDLTLWLKLEATIGLARTRQRGHANRMEGCALEFHQRVYAGFEAVAQRYPERVATVTATGSLAEVSARIQAVVESKLYQWYTPYLTDS